MNMVYDVIISGAGPVGLFLGCELALAKCSVLILEKADNPHSPLKQLPFGIRGLSSPTIDALDRRNLLQQLEVPKRLKDPHSDAKQGPRRQVGHFAGIPLQEGNIDTDRWKFRLPSSPPSHLIAEMEELETVLTIRAKALGVEIRRGFPVTELQQFESEVTVRSGEHLFQGKWVVGCDGSRSSVRKLGGFDFAGTDPEFTGYSVRIELLDPQKLNPGRNLTEAGMYFQSQPGFFAIQDFDGGAFHDSKEPVTAEHVQEVLRRISGADVTVTALPIAATWTDRARQSTRYRKGRILIAGDAAHIHAPLGGQGLNLGIGDAMNLGWKLAATVLEKAPQSLLDSYFSERHPIGARVLDWSRAQVAIMMPDPGARALHAIVRDVLDTPDGATYFAGRVWGIDTRYDLGGDHPLVGRSIPNFELDDGSTVGQLMHDGQAILLDFEGASSLRAFAERHRGRVNYVSCKATERLSLNAVMARPDGYVCWATNHEVDDTSLAEAVASANWLVSP